MSGERANQPSASDDNALAWRQLGIADSILSAAIATFGNPERASHWMEVLDGVGRRFLSAGTSELYWKDDRYLANLKESELTPEGFAQWVRAGVSPLWVPSLAKRIDLGEALALIRDWGAAPTVEQRENSASELASVLSRGIDLFELKRLIETGLTGNQICGWSNSGLSSNEWNLWRSRGLDSGEVAEWVRSELPPEAWLEWRECGVDPRYAREIFAAGEKRPDIAAQWAGTGLSMNSVVAYRHLGCSPQEAASFAKAGFQPQDLMRCDDGVKAASGTIALEWNDFSHRPDPLPRFLRFAEI